MPSKINIDMEKLKTREQILFYADVTLFEDELHDNGTAVLSAKIVIIFFQQWCIFIYPKLVIFNIIINLFQRVMPTGLFVLMRFFLRVDGVLVRINDTRVYHEFGTSFMIREYTGREGDLKEMKVIISFLLEVFTP